MPEAADAATTDAEPLLMAEAGPGGQPVRQSKGTGAAPGNEAKQPLSSADDRSHGTAPTTERPPANGSEGGAPGDQVQCAAPPDNLNVAWMRSQGVPHKLAPSILLRWRSAHERGEHQVCAASRQLVDDLKNKAPPDKAEAMFSLALQASEFGVDEAFETMELYRLYEGWRGRKNYKAFFAEMEKLPKPNDASEA